MLWENFLKTCTKMVQTVTNDAYGGTSTTLTDGTTFSAAIVVEKPSQAEEANRDKYKATYTVTYRGCELKYHDIFKCGSTYYRVISDGADKTTPDTASFTFSQVSAMIYLLPITEDDDDDD